MVSAETFTEAGVLLTGAKNHQARIPAATISNPTAMIRRAFISIMITVFSSHSQEEFLCLARFHRLIWIRIPPEAIYHHQVNLRKLDISLCRKDFLQPSIFPCLLPILRYGVPTV